MQTHMQTYMSTYMHTDTHATLFLLLFLSSHSFAIVELMVLYDLYDIQQ